MSVASNSSLVHRRLAPHGGVGPPSSRYVLSDDSTDRMGDVIDPAGWDLTAFKRHPIALFGHHPHYVVGKWTDVGVEGGWLTGSLELLPPDSSPQAKLVHALRDADAIAISVGFRPLESEPLDADRPWGARRFTRAELVEACGVAVPASPNARMVGKALGIDLSAGLAGGVTQEEPAMPDGSIPIVERSAPSGALVPVPMPRPALGKPPKPYDLRNV